MTGYRDIEFSQIADDWDSAPLGREVEPPMLLMRNGLTVKQNKEEGELRVTRIETISGGLISEERVRFASGLSAEHVEKYRIRKGDILFSHINSDPHLGKTAIALKDYPDLLHGMNLLLLRANKKILVPEFLHFLCCYYRVKGVFVKICSRSVNQSSINQAKLKALEIPLPPLPEQQKIAGVLGLVQGAMEQQKRLLALTAELKKALLHKLFTEGLRGESQKQTEIGPVPESWELVSLGLLAKVGNGSTPKRDNASYWQGGSIPWLNSAKIHERFISEADQFVTDLAVKECHLPRVKPGSLLIAITGQGKTLGNSALVSFETCINQHLAYAQLTSPQVVPEFALWFMQTRYEHLRSISQAGGSTKGALTCGYLKTYPIPVPVLDEQREIAEVFAAIDRKEKMHERKHATITALFRTLLHQLMTAQIRVHDIDLEGVLAQAGAEMDSKS